MLARLRIHLPDRIGAAVGAKSRPVEQAARECVGRGEAQGLPDAFVIGIAACEFERIGAGKVGAIAPVVQALQGVLEQDIGQADGPVFQLQSAEFALVVLVAP